MTLLEQMIAAAERVAEAASKVREQATKAEKDARYVARSLRDDRFIPINQCGWFISSLDAEAVELQTREFDRLHRELRDEAIAKAKTDHAAKKK